MSFTEPGRHRLHQALVEALGPDEANTLMAHLPPFAWTDIATKADLSALRDDLTRHFDASLTEFRGEMHMKFAAMDEKFTQRFSQVDSQFSQIDARFSQVDVRFSEIDARFSQMDSKLVRTDAKIDELHSEMRVGFADLRSEMRSEVADLRSEMHKSSLVIVGGLASLMTLLAAVTNLFG